MKKILYLHIGAHKTGSSAIQKFLSLNRGKLVRNGYLYPYAGNRHEHHFVPHGIQGRTLFYSNPDEVTETLVNEISNSKQNNIIISSEDFELLKGDEIKTLKELIPAGLLVKVIYYVRTQDEQLESRYNQRVKTRAIRLKKTFHDFYRSGSFPINELDYYSLLLPWKEAFGKENIIVRVYEKEQLPNGIFSDFLSAVGLELDESYEIPKENINPSLNWDLIEIIRLCNIHLNDDKDFHYYLLNDFRNLDLKDDKGKKRLLSPQERRDFIALYSESNEKVASEYLGREDGRLFYAPLPELDEHWEPYEGLTIEKTVPIFTHMIYTVDRKYSKRSRKLQKMTGVNKKFKKGNFSAYLLIKSRIKELLKRC